MATPRKSDRTAPVDIDALERERARLAWSIETLAANSGLSPKTVRRILKGTKQPYWSTLRAIADAMGLAVDTLTGGILGGLAGSLMKNTFDFRIRTVGVLERPEQLEQLVKVANEIVTRLRAEGVTVVSHDTTLSLPQDPINCRRVLIALEGSKKFLGGAGATGGSTFTKIPFWFLYAVKLDRLPELIRALANGTFDPVASPTTYGDLLAEGHEPEVPDVIVALSNSFSPFPDGG